MGRIHPNLPHRGKATERPESRHISEGRGLMTLPGRWKYLDSRQLRCFCAIAMLASMAQACGDLFHSTAWESRCSASPDGPGCDGHGGASGQGGGGLGGAMSGNPMTCEPESSVTCYDGPAGTDGVGLCKAGTKTCDARGSPVGPCLDQVTPSVEVCGNGLDEDCDGLADNGCVYPSCKELPIGARSGVYLIDPSRNSRPIETYCETLASGGGWALVYNSVGSLQGDTP